MIQSLPPLGLYIHLPWCIRKCPYCDFNSHAMNGDEIPEAAYIQGLISDLESQLPSVWGRVLQTVFIGGGTPSLFSADSIQKLLDAVRTRIRCNPQMEVTLEANPGTLEAGRYADYRTAGVNRLSLGVQSFNDEHLRALGRIHDGKAAIKAIESVHEAGYQNFNIDLMFGLPNQDSRAALADIQQAIELQASHISHYELTLEPNTLFHHSPPVLPGDDSIADMQDRCGEALSENGFNRYEISAWSRPEQACKHNLNYWRFGDYLGIGAGAHGKITMPADNRIQRSTKARHPKSYLRAPQQTSIKTVATDQLGLEFMMNALRLIDGVEAELFEQRTGLTARHIEETIKQARQQGLFHNNPLRIHPTAQGIRFLNELLTRFL